MAKSNKNLVSLELIQRAKTNTDVAMKVKTTDLHPALQPTKQPTLQPTTDKTSDLDPTKQPTATLQPTLDPTQQPTLDPTIKDPSDPIWRLTDRQAVVLGYFIRQKNRIVRRRYLMEETYLKENTVKTIIKALSQLQFISNVERQRNQGARYTLNNHLCGHFLKHRWPEILKYYGCPPKFHIQPTLDPTQQPTLDTTDIRPDTTTDSIEEEEILLLNKIDVIYPTLHGIGFERVQIQDVIQSWKLNSIDIMDLPESLQRADYAVEHKSFKMNDPLNYVYSALMKGIFRKPPGYKSRAEIQAEDRLAEQKQISEKNDEAFQLWCDNLSPDKRAELCKGIPRIKQSVHLRDSFDNKTKAGIDFGIP
jgi:hypothetical protein